MWSVGWSALLQCRGRGPNRLLKKQRVMRRIAVPEADYAKLATLDGAIDYLGS